MSCLSEAVAPLALKVRETCWKALDHPQYAVRFETGTAIAALVRAQPSMGVEILNVALEEMNTHHQVDFPVQVCGSCYSDANPRSLCQELVELVSTEPSEKEKTSKGKRDAERKAHMYALHGRATVVALALQVSQGDASISPPGLMPPSCCYPPAYYSTTKPQGVPELAFGLPRQLTDHAFGTAEALCNRQV